MRFFVKLSRRAASVLHRFAVHCENFDGERACPVCDRKVATYVAFPAGFLKNWQDYGFEYNPLRFETLNYESYSCPFCGASDRDRLYALYIREISDDRESVDMLDIAPVPALSSWLRRNPSINYRSADLVNPLADDKVDITDMRIYKDGQFDLILCSHVLEHVPDDVSAMRELYRVLKAEGKAIVMVPVHLDLDQIEEDPDCTDEELRWRYFGQGDHVRLYSKDGFVDRLKKVGFKVNELTQRDFGIQAFHRAGIREDSVLYVAEKE